VSLRSWDSAKVLGKKKIKCMLLSLRSRDSAKVLGKKKIVYVTEPEVTG
jgi:hypothetical protein